MEDTIGPTIDTLDVIDDHTYHGMDRLEKVLSVGGRPLIIGHKIRT